MEISLQTPKLRSLKETLLWREELKKQGKKLVLTNGVFDLLHTGHLFYLRQARELGDALLIALNSDESVRSIKGPLRPVQSQAERAYALDACSFVDGIVIFHTPRLTAEINAIKPDIYCKAGDYTIETINQEERRALESVGAQIKFMSFLKGFSTTSLIARISAAGEL
jgi:rfaE bifunctional protein nucleotidyltransferase chain/domain